MPFCHHRALLVVVATLLVVSGASAQQSTLQPVFPARGQSEAQQNRDEADCRKLAVEKSGFDPAVPALARPAKVPVPVIVTEPAVAEAAPVASDGASTGQEADDALVAEVISATAARHAASRKAAQKEKQAATLREAARTEFRQENAACLERRGYRLGWQSK